MQQEEQEPKSILTEIPEHIKDYVETQIQYYTLVAAEKAGSAASKFALGIILSLFGYLFLLFLSIAFALWIGKALDNYFVGFFIIAGVYLLISILVFILKDKLIQTPITNLIITKIANHNKKEKSDETEHA